MSEGEVIAETTAKLTDVEIDMKNQVDLDTCNADSDNITGKDTSTDEDVKHDPLQTGVVSDKNPTAIQTSKGKDYGEQSPIETGVPHSDTAAGISTDKGDAIVPTEAAVAQGDNEIGTPKDEQIEQEPTVRQTEQESGGTLGETVENDLGKPGDGGATTLGETVENDLGKPGDGGATAAGVDGSVCIMEGQVHIDKVQYHLKLTSLAVTWVRSAGKSAGSTSVPVGEIVSVKPYTRKHSLKDKIDGFTLCHVKHQKKCVLKRSSQHFLTDVNQVDSWVHKIQEQLNALVGRPRKSLVLVNPVSGRRKGPKMCTKYVEPIFKEANIQADIIVTEKAHHTEEILADYDLSSIDSLVLVGGDGLYHEAVNGLQTRLMAEAGLDRDSPESEIQMIDLPMGIVPCGTGNGIADAMYGCKDVETSVLAIMIGNKTPSNMMSVYSGGKLMAYSSLLIGYGVFGDLIYVAENRRSSLGVFRYPVTFAEMLVFRSARRMNLTLDYLCPDPGVDLGSQSATSPHMSARPGTSTASPATTTYQGHPETDGGAVLDENPKSKTASSFQQPRPMPVSDNNNLETKLESDTNDSEVKQASSAGVDNVNGNWKTIQGQFTLLVVFPGDLIQMLTNDIPTDNRSTRFLLAKPYSRGAVLKLFVSFITKDMSVLNSDKLIHDLVMEYKVRLNDPSDPASDFGIKEHIVNIDGEPFRLPEPALHVKLHSERIKLFSSVQKCSTIQP